MTASVVERRTTSLPASTNTNVALTTTLVSTDVVFIEMIGSYLIGTTVTSSPSATWSAIDAVTRRVNNYAIRFRIATGFTGSLTITLNPSSVAGYAVIRVLRGLNASSVSTILTGTYDTSSVTLRSTSSTSCGTDQIAISSVLYEGASGLIYTNPSSPYSPSTGWATAVGGTAASGVGITSNDNVIASSGTFQASVLSNGLTFMGITGILFGTATASSDLTGSWGPIPIL